MKNYSFKDRTSSFQKFAFGKIGNWSNKKQLDYKDEEYKSSLAE